LFGTGPPAHERLADGRLIGNFAFARAGFFRSDECEGFRVLAWLLHGDAVAHAGDFGDALAVMDDGRRPQDQLQLLNAAFEKGLLLLGHDVIGVFREIAHLDRLAQAGGQFGAFGRSQFLQFRLELCGAFGSQISFSHKVGCLTALLHIIPFYPRPRILFFLSYGRVCGSNSL